MANEKNLVPNSARTPSERRKNAQKAGKASGEARRQRKAMKDLMQILLDCSPNKAIVNKMLKMGLENEDLIIATALNMAMIEQALKGNVAAYKEITELVGEAAEKTLHLSGQVTMEDNRKAIQDFADKLFGAEK